MSTQQITDHFRDNSFQAINCTLVLTFKQQPNNTQKQKKNNPMTNKLALVKKKTND